MERVVQLVLEPSSDRFDPQDDNWLKQRSAFVAELRAGVGGVAIEGASEAGAKGAFGEIVLSLASAGTLTAVVELLRSWLTRDTGRKVTATWFADGMLQSLELSGHALDDATFDDLVRAVARQMAEPE